MDKITIEKLVWTAAGEKTYTVPATATSIALCAKVGTIEMRLAASGVGWPIAEGSKEVLTSVELRGLVLTFYAAAQNDDLRIRVLHGVL